MSPSARTMTVILALLLCSAVVGTGLLVLEKRLAPLPGPNDLRTFDQAVDALEASTMRWQAFYLPALQLVVSIAVGFLIVGRGAWYQNLLASLFVLALVFIQHATTSFSSAGIAVPAYLFAGMAVAGLVRAWRAKRDPAR